MICKNCSAEFDDSIAQCPECGMENETVTEVFTEGFAQECEQEAESAEADCETADDIKEEDKAQAEASADEAAEPAEETRSVEESAADVQVTDEEKADEEADKEKSDSQKSAEKNSEQDNKEKMQKPVAARRPAQRRPAPGRPVGGRPAAGKNISRRPVRVTRQEKRMITVIMALMCFVGLCAAVTAYVNITTDLFSVDTSTDKIVAGVGLTSAEEKQLEELLSNCYSAVKNEFDSESIGVEDMLMKINPADKGNVYSRVNSTTEKLQTTADPAKRFADENGEYAYYKLSEKKVDKVLECFGIEAYRGENGESYYYCDGYYYFAAKPTDSKLVSAEVTKTRRILDGRYYAEFYFYTENEGEVKKSKTRYLVFEMNKNEASGDISFAIERTSSKDFVGADGKISALEGSYSKKKEVIEGRTKDGTLYCRYVIEYPVLEGDSISHQNINAMFESTVSSYKMKAESAEADYKSFKKAGGEKEQLPYIENIVASIVFEDEKKISFAERIYKLDPVIEEKSEESDSYYYYTEQEESEPEARLYDITIESYTIDKQSGDFVLKDSVVGKDYALVSEVLYRIYKGYDYERALPRNEEEEYYYDDTPEDTEGIGTAIYESAWTYTKSGISFWYKTVDGYMAEVTIPSKVAKKLAKIT